MLRRLFFPREEERPQPPEHTRAPRLRRRAPSPTAVHPEALPGTTHPRFNREFIGTIIFDGNTPGDVEQFFEAVDPGASSPSRVSARRDDGGFGPSQDAALSAVEAVATAKGAEPLQPTVATTRRRRCRRSEAVLMQGGFAIFTDDFVDSHPNGAVAALTEQCRQERDLHRPRVWSSVRDSPAREEERKRKWVLQQYVKQAEEGRRPVFRRIPSPVAYGRAEYLT